MTLGGDTAAARAEFLELVAMYHVLELGVLDGSGGPAVRTVLEAAAARAGTRGDLELAAALRERAGRRGLGSGS